MLICPHPREFPNLEKSVSHQPPVTYRAKGSASGLILYGLLSVVILRMLGTIRVELSTLLNRSLLSTESGPMWFSEEPADIAPIVVFQIGNAVT
jgi:hypothetical protein